MAKKANPRRYAQAAFEIALEKNKLKRWHTDLQKVVKAVSDGDFLAALESPKIKFEDKSRLLKKRLGSIDPLVMNLLLLLISRSGIGMIAEIALEYRRLWDAHRGIQSGDITTAVRLDAKDKKQLAGRLGDLVGAKVEIKANVDPDILGGIVARVGDKLLDGSTRGKLLALKKELVSGEIKH